jgi:hypothetical protein
MIKAETPTKAAIAFDPSLALLNRMRRGTENEPEYRVITLSISTDAVIVHVKYWEELVRFGDLPGMFDYLQFARQLGELLMRRARAQHEAEPRQVTA